MKGRAYTLEDRIQLETMLRDGYSHKEISEALARTLYSIRSEYNRNKDDRGNYNAYVAHERVRVGMIKKTNPSAHLTEEMKGRLKEFIEQNKNQCWIGKELGISTTSVSYWAKKWRKEEKQLPLKISSDSMPKQVDETPTYLSDEGVVESIINEGNMIKANVSLEFPKAILDRIEALEQQIEIILDHITKGEPNDNCH